MKVLVREIPFSIGCCASKSSVDVPRNQPKSAEENPSTVTTREDGEMSSTQVRTKSSFCFPPQRKSKTSSGIRSLINSIKNCSQLFVLEEEMEEMEEEEMEIGYPTDVKHVTHIGLDGTTTTNNNCPLKGWQNLKPPEIISLPSISFKQFEMAMAAQVHHGHA